MKKNISLNDFVELFKGEREENFSREGKKALFIYLSGYEQETGEEITLDIVALCCSFMEFKNFKDFKKYYKDVKTIRELEEKTTVIFVNGKDDKGGIIIENF